MESLVLDFRNGRYRAFRVDSVQEVRLILDMPDRVVIRQNPDGTMLADFEAPADQQPRKNDEAEFVNLIQLSNTVAVPVDLSRIFETLVPAFCARAALPWAAPDKSVVLRYLIPFNSSEVLWTALPAQPFRVSNITFIPAGFVDEFLMLMNFAVRSCADYFQEPQSELYLLTTIDGFLSIIRVGSRRDNGVIFAEATDIRPFGLDVWDRPSSSAGPVHLAVVGDETDISQAGILARTLREKGRKPGKIVASSHEALVKESVGRSKGLEQEDIELAFGNYAGVYSEGGPGLVLGESPQCYPYSMHESAEMTFQDGNALLTFF
ncbi:MAG: hypothetical protein V2B18_05735, partial [Pseudomonadota bacterium]